MTERLIFFTGSIATAPDELSEISWCAGEGFWKASDLPEELPPAPPIGGILFIGMGCDCFFRELTKRYLDQGIVNFAIFDFSTGTADPITKEMLGEWELTIPESRSTEWIEPAPTHENFWADVLDIQSQMNLLVEEKAEIQKKLFDLGVA